ncbi:MAG TPA: FtsK/SpoIIIE domain-containing protein [Ilumatobacteraceae bacterium]|nr:FtsK/SpoIIIE domain-containing protein [Ilumatobacteraceae bacterium]
MATDPQVDVDLGRPARLVVAGPDGLAVELWPDPGSTTVGELARAVGLDPAAGVSIDGVDVDPATVLDRTRVRTGSSVDATSGRPRADEAHPAALVTVVQVAGPAVEPPVGLGPGRHLVGRAAGAAVRLADQHVEPHHAVLDVASDGAVSLLQLAGRVPVIVGGVPVEGATGVPPHVTVEMGASRLLVDVRPAAADGVATGGSADDRWRRSVLRGPRRSAAEPVAPIVPPSPPTESVVGGWGVTGAVVSLVGSVAIAAVLRQPVFALLGAVGAVASLAAAGTGRARDARGRRRRRRRDAEACGAFAIALAASAARLRHRAIAEAIERLLLLGAPERPDLWSRRPAHGDAFRVLVGWGSAGCAIPLSVDIDTLRLDLRPFVDATSVLSDVPIDIDLASDAGTAIAIVGDDAPAVARSFIIQLAVQCGPADWRLVVVTDDIWRHRWAEWLPHAAIGASATAVLELDDARVLTEALERVADDARRVVVLTDVPETLATRTSPLRRFLAGERSVTTIVTIDRGDAVPAFCRSVLEVGTRSRARWSHPAGGSVGCDRLHVTGLAADAAYSIARCLAGFSDPEDPSGAGTELTTEVRISELPGVPNTATAIAASWRSGGDDPAPAAPIGVSLDGVVEIDLVRDGPHALIAGTTGAGKSEVLRTLVVAIAARVGPDHITFVLVDYKGGATFDACADLPHTVGLVTDLDDGLAARALVSLEAEVHRRERLLRQSGATDLAGHRAIVGAPPLPRLIVVIDEFAALAVDLPDFIPALVGVAQRGRSLGVHLVLATQRPAGVVDDHIRANTNLRLALRLHDRADALDVVGDPAPAALPRGVPGRAVMRLGPSDLVEFQIARCTTPLDHGEGERTELELLVGEIRRAMAIAGTAAPHRPWLPPLPAELHDVDEHGAVGVVDEPALQRRTPLRWDRSRGNLALFGAMGSGTTTTLRMIVTAATSVDPPSRLHVYVVDTTGDASLDALAGAHCADVIRLHEVERVDRLVRRLAAELDRRRAESAADRGPDIVVAIDGLTALRESLEHVERGASSAEFDRVLADGPAVGIATVAVLDAGRGGGTVLARFAQRWVFHLDDPSGAPALGVATRRVPRAIPGRLIVAASGLEAQVALLERDPLVGDGGPVAVETLPRFVPAHALRRTHASIGTVVALPVGLDFAALSTAVLHVPTGEHALIVGPARSGRSWALIRLIEAWRELHPGAPVSVICPTRSSPLVDRYGAAEALDGASDGSRLIAVDDCERFDDPDGRLSAHLARTAGVTTVFAAGRADSIRVAYGHWTAVCRRSRLGLVMAAGGELDGDLLGAVLPRRTPIPARPGLAWLVDGGGQSLVQLALDEPIS